MAFFAYTLPGVFVVFMLLVQLVKRSYSQSELLVAFLFAWVLSALIPIVIPNFVLGAPEGARYLLTSILGSTIVVGVLAMIRTSDIVPEPEREKVDADSSESGNGAEILRNNTISRSVKSADSSQRLGVIVLLVGIGIMIFSLLSVRYWHPTGGIINNLAQGEILLEQGTTRNVGTAWDAKFVTEGRVAIPLKYPVGLSIMVILLGVGLIVLPMTRPK